MPECVAVIATYNPQHMLSDTVEMLMEAGVTVIIVDDASWDAESVATLNTSEILGSIVVRKKSNLGIGDSLNRGLRLARESGFKYLLTLDQDTKIDASYVRTSIDYFETLQRRGFAVGLVTASTVNGSIRKPNLSNHGVSTGVDVMQSGSVYSLAVLEEIGEFNESFVMDCVDTEYCLRLRAAGYDIFWVPDANMNHELGDTQDAQFFGRTVAFGSRIVRVSHHSDTRRYYMSRNRMALLIKFGSVDPLWLWKSLRAYFKETIYSVLFEPKRLRRILTIMEGTLDGATGRTGLRHAKHVE